MSIKDITKLNDKEKNKYFNDILNGHTIVEADNDKLILDNGIVLTMFQSEFDCCSIAEGTWKIINNAENKGITDVEVNYSEVDEENYITINILHDNNLIATGNGFANTGSSYMYLSSLSLKVTVEDKAEEETVILRDYNSTNV